MPRLKVTARSNSPFGTIDDAQHKFVIKVGTGLKGEAGAQGIQGVKGDKGDVGASVPVANELGLSATIAVSQKLLTDKINDMNIVLGDIDSALTNINGV